MEGGANGLAIQHVQSHVELVTSQDIDHVTTLRLAMATERVPESQRKQFTVTQKHVRALDHTVP